MSDSRPEIADVTAVVVTHNSSGVIAELLRCLPVGLPAVIVDNQSSDGTPDVVRENRPDATVIERGDNPGYGGGVNVGLAQVETPFALVIGPDVSFGEGTIETLLQAAERYPDAALIAPAIRNPDGSIERSHDVELTKRQPDRGNQPALHPVGPICAEFLSGAVWLGRMAALNAVDGFDPALFLYYEDDDISRRLRAEGYSLVLDPAASVTHVGGGSVPSTVQYSRLKYWHMGWSRLYYARKHDGAFAVWIEYLRVGGRLFFKSLGYSVTGRRAKARRDWARLSGMTAFIVGRPSR